MIKTREEKKEQCKEHYPFVISGRQKNKSLQDEPKTLVLSHLKKKG